MRGGVVESGPQRAVRAAASMALAVFLLALPPSAPLRAQEGAAPPHRTPESSGPQPSPAPIARPQLDLRIGHAGTVEAVAFSTDGNTLASAGADQTVKLWDVATGTLERTLADHTGLVFTVAFSPDGVTLASGSFDRTVKLWDARAGRLLHTLRGHTDNVMALAFSPDHRMMASGDASGLVMLWDAVTGKELPILADHRVSGTIVALAFSPDGRTLSSLETEGPQRALTVAVWDLATGRQQGFHQLEGYRGGVRWAAFSPDGKTIASGQSQEEAPSDVLLWDAETGRLRWRQSGHTERVFAVAFSPDGKILASAGIDGTVKLWEAETGAPLRRLNHDRPVFSVAFSPDGKRLASGDATHLVHLWEVPLGASLWTSGQKDAVISVAASRDGKTIASGGEDTAVRLWDARTGTLQRVLTGHTGPVTSVAFSPDRQTLASGSSDASIRLWNAQTGAWLRTLTGHDGGVLAVAFSPDGRTLASSAWDRTVRLWDTTTAKLLRTLTGHTAAVRCVAFSPDGQTLVSGSWDNTVRLWNAHTGELRHTLGYEVRCVAFSPDGKTLVSGADNNPRLSDAQTGELLRAFTGPGGSSIALSFAPDGKTVASAHRNAEVRLWDTQTGKLLRTLVGHTAEVRSVAYSPDGKRIISGGEDQTVRMWDASSGRPLATLMALPPRENEPVSSDWLTVTPDGYYDASPGAARFIRWKLGADSFPVEAYERSFRRPDLLRKVLAGEVLAERPEVRRFATGQAIPPQVTITQPHEGQTVSGNTVRVEVTITGARSDVRVEVRVNGRPMPIKPITVGGKPIEVGAKPIEVGAKPIEVGAKSIKLIGRPVPTGARPITVGGKPIPAAHRFVQHLTAEVPLPLGESQVTLKAIATDADALQGWAELHLLRPLAVAAGKPAAPLGDLYVLAIGVSHYQNPRYDLKFAAADATAFAGLWDRMAGSLYEHVHVTRLTDTQATTDEIQSELFKLLRTVTKRDSIALFLSGHGVQAGEGEFYFAAHDIDAASPERVKATALPWTVFETILAKVDAKRVFLFLDACHSGSALGEQQASNERLAEALARHGNVLVFSSSRGGEYSYEDAALGHGAFTEALLEGIGQGKADLAIGGEQDGKITAAKLLAYLQARVPQLTQQRQTPTCPLLYDFGEGFLLARAR